jgi:hypothetical protein
MQHYNSAARHCARSSLQGGQLPHKTTPADASGLSAAYVLLDASRQSHKVCSQILTDCYARLQSSPVGTLHGGRLRSLRGSFGYRMPLLRSVAQFALFVPLVANAPQSYADSPSAHAPLRSLRPSSSHLIQMLTVPKPAPPPTHPANRPVHGSESRAQNCIISNCPSYSSHTASPNYDITNFVRCASP